MRTNATKDKPTGRGGKREGAGRPPRHGSAGIKSSIHMPPEGVALLDAQRGEISRSEWFFRLLTQEDLRRKREQSEG
jgi:hypothetical protein